ncbi:MAG: phytase [Sphingomonas sp.]|nr:phytase [Sphingomonas sp.]
MRTALALTAAAAVAACASVPAIQPGTTAAVAAIVETAPVGTVNADAADDPAIWRNAANPSASLIVATDKKAGLYVYGLDGRVRSFMPEGLLNNVDLIDLGQRGIIVAASDRNVVTAAKIRLYRLDPVTARLTAIGVASGGAGEAYGICLARAPRGAIDAFSVLKQGTIEQVRLRIAGGAVTGTTVRRLSVPTQPEGCVVDERTGQLFVGEERAGIWRFDARADAGLSGTIVAPVDGKQLVADVEGLALAPVGRRGGYLVASSQGDNAYALYRLPDMQPAGRFRIVAGQLGSTEETDGIALALGNFGPSFPRGLFVAQDGMNAPAAQNFKLVSWEDTLAALSRPGRSR